MLIFRPLYIVTGTSCDCGTLFYRCPDVLAWCASDCGFTTTFYKAAGLIMGEKPCVIADKLMVSVTNRVD